MVPVAHNPDSTERAGAHMGKVSVADAREVRAPLAGHRVVWCLLFAFPAALGRFGLFAFSAALGCIGGGKVYKSSLNGQVALAIPPSQPSGVAS